jgi:outer membrane protein
LIVANEKETTATILFRDGVEKEVQYGLKSLLDLLDAQQDVVNAEQSLIKARGDHVLAGYALLMQMGKLNADTFGLTPAFVTVEALPIHDLPFSGIIPKVTYPE